MSAVRNVAREKLEQGQLALGVGIRMSRSVEIAKAMAVAGFDWLFLDMEHGVMSLEACAQISTAALDAGIAPIARVPNGEYSIATRALDNGALGIVVPHVDTATEAREVVNRLKYPPVGHRRHLQRADHAALWRDGCPLRTVWPGRAILDDRRGDPHRLHAEIAGRLTQLAASGPFSTRPA